MVSEVREHPTSKSGGSKPTTAQVLKAIDGPFFLSNTEEDDELTWRSQWNIDFTLANIKPLKMTISKNMIPVLERELEHAAQEGAIRRARDVTHRRSYGCLTSIFSGTYLCANCGREYCSKCCSELRAGDKRNVKCQAPNYHQEQHNFENFIPVTEFIISELEAHILEMKKETDCDTDTSISAAAPLGMPSTTAVDPDTIVVVAADARSKSTWSPPVDPSGVASLPVHEFHHTQLDEETFRKIWARGEPLVVSGVLDKAQLQWTPQYFTEKHGTAACTIVDCDDDKAKLIPSTVAEFFNDFGHYDGRATILKLKDWPPTSEFSQSFPDEYKDFHRFVPMPNYTRRDGVLNLASNWPVNAVAPDIGPKMYSALVSPHLLFEPRHRLIPVQESKETPGGKGSTRLHKDMADAVNVMTYAAPKDGREGCAAWDIFRAEDSEKIRQFLREDMSWEDVDGIHAQCFYLDSALRKKLFDKYGVKSWRIYQRTGDAVFIPAGCAHQVCNLADTIKIAVDFVSPQNVDRCAQLTTEFRAMNQKRKWKEDVLSLESTMWYAWLSCQTQEKRLEKGKGRASA
ncbi:hypothetical protein CALVIDRAFT_193322 [Calocera viscosa TUFC12733]|uniref:JmjC domain-containing protein n=1 Tax=Calocera viscosa (strain TUFC12733) TaxID=1330018 RepID=A0A167KQS9_CALVF|nr:hypothetical protein CALVIDRAFT_193322 [Calocera viscosa TUFC12733]